MFSRNILRFAKKQGYMPTYDEDDYIMDEDLYVDETALADSLDVQLSTEEFTKYEITKPIVLDFHQIRRKSKCEMCPVSDGYPDESSI